MPSPDSAPSLLETLLDAIVIHEQDNIAVCLKDVKAGTTLRVMRGTDAQSVTVNADITVGHKLAVRPIAVGEQVRKYAEVIGVMTQNATVGDHVHLHNMTDCV